MKSLYILTLAAAMAMPAFGARTVNYARASQNLTLDIRWGADNYGDIVWETSADGGKTWTNAGNDGKKSYTFKVVSPVLVRSVVNGDPACPPIINEYDIKTVSFSSDVTSLGGKSVEMEITKPSFGDAQIVEYGYTAALSGVGRTFTTLPRTAVGTSLPKGDSFTIECTGLAPDTDYQLRAYFKTADGSYIFGPGKLAKTLEGIQFDSEDWIIEKTEMQVPFSIPGFSGSNANAEFWFGTDKNNLKQYKVESLGNNKYRSELIKNLKPGTSYLAVAKATIDGNKEEVSKEVKTWSDYSTFKVDETVKPVSHVVEWEKDASQMVCLTPENRQVEYPRMCRIDENKILLTYHGGNTDHWQNSYLRKSYDNGRTWTDPVEIYNIQGKFYGTGFHRICNPEMTKLQNGWVILTVVANANPEGNQNSKVFACISKDGGETWSNPIIVGRGRTWEPQVIQLPNGELELLVSSEAHWWDTQQNNMFQEILSTRSTDNGETWTTYKRASYKPGARDGMPVAVVMQGNKGVLFIEESVNGGIAPSLQWRPLDGEWDTADWDGKEDDRRWLTSINRHAGAPYMIQLPTGEFMMMGHTNQTGSVWQTNRPQVVMADNTGHNFKYSRVPLNGMMLPAECGAYYNSFFLYDNDTVWLLFTKAQYKGSSRVESDVMVLKGKIVEK